jgi:hypothetical protein
VDASDTSELELMDLGAPDLLAGDLVLVDGTWAHVLDEAMTMHGSLGPFDDFQIFVGARIRLVGQGESQLWVWEPTDPVSVRRQRGITKRRV